MSGRVHREDPLSSSDEPASRQSTSHIVTSSRRHSPSHESDRIRSTSQHRRPPMGHTMSSPQATPTRLGVLHATPPGVARGRPDEELRFGLINATPPGGGRGRPSDSGYGTDSPASVNTGGAHFRYEYEMEVGEEGAVGYDAQLQGWSMEDDLSLGIGLDEEEEEDDDEVFLEQPFMSYDSVDGGETENRNNHSRQSRPIDIPRPLSHSLPSEVRSVSFTPPRYGQVMMRYSPGGIWIGSPRHGSEGTLAAGMRALATMLHSQTTSVPALRPGGQSPSESSPLLPSGIGWPPSPVRQSSLAPPIVTQNGQSNYNYC